MTLYVQRIYIIYVIHFLKGVTQNIDIFRDIQIF